MKKLKKNGGFTLVEMLIVVAIIAILVAVSIPMVNSALEKSRHAVDQANIRDAVGLASIEYLTSDEFKASTTPTTGGTANYEIYNYVVDANHQGKLDKNGTGVSAQCKCTNDLGTLQVAVNKADGTVMASWTIDSTGKTTKTANFPSNATGNNP